MKKSTLKLISLAAMLGLSQPLWATNKALLIGISDYQNKKDKLEGPVNDVVALKKSLQQHWGFTAQNIKTLLNYDATHSNILSELTKLAKQATADDQIFIYFSGHGTSAHNKDENGSGLPLPYSSGALVPYGYYHAGDTRQQIVDNLLVGKRDFRPIFSQLDKTKAQVFVIFDSCYSGNSVRGLYNKGSLLPTRTTEVFDSVVDDDEPAACFDCGTAAVDPYPYKNILYLSAASPREKAQDIGEYWLKQYPTMDNKPHGAFTDALLRALSGKIKTDQNNDGKTNYGELYAAVKDFMRSRGYSHDPQILPVAMEDSQQLSLNNVLGKRGILRNINVSTPSVLFTVSVPAGEARLISRLAQFPALKISDVHADLVVKKQGNHYLFINKSGDLIGTLNSPNLKQFVGRVQQEAWKKQFKQVLQSRPSFNIDFNINKGLDGSSAKEGDLVAFTLRSEKPMHLLLLDVDSHGNLAVLYPYMKHELSAIPAQDIKFIPSENKADWIKVQKPFGIDHLIAIGFAKQPDFLKEFVGKEVLLLQSDLYKKLSAYLKHAQYGFSELDLLTVSKNAAIN